MRKETIIRYYEDLAKTSEGRLPPRAYYIPKGDAKYTLLSGKWRFFFDATDTSKEYLVEETKRDNCEYAVFPAANFNAFYGSTTFSKKKLPQLPHSVFDREERHGLCRLKVKI